MAKHRLRILLVEDSPADAELFHDAAQEINKNEEYEYLLEVVRVETIAATEAFLKSNAADVILLDLSLPDSDGVNTINRLAKHFFNVPVVVLTGLHDQQMERDSIHQGAQDYLSKDSLSPELLCRALRHAIERHRLVGMLKSLALLDELTGLYNRRGFMHLADRQIKLAKRQRGDVVLLFADLDNLQAINNDFGNENGDNALVDTANILRATFRESDIIARMGDDEFAIFAIDAAQGETSIMYRLEAALVQFNLQKQRPFSLSVSFALLRMAPEESSNLDELLIRAARSMYDQKRKKKVTPSKVPTIYVKSS